VPPDTPDGPVELPAPAQRALRLVLGVVAVLVALLQVAVGIQVGRLGPLLGGGLLLVLGALLILGGVRAPVVGRGGIHTPNRLRERELPWSTVAALRARPGPGGRVQVLVERAGQPATAALRLASLTRDQADRLLPAIAAHAAAHEVPLHDER
jgi:hypothetical protein